MDNKQDLTTSLIPVPPVEYPHLRVVPRNVSTPPGKKTYQKATIPDVTKLGGMSVYEPALMGKEAIARYFNKMSARVFWRKHGRELKHFDIVFKVYSKDPLNNARCVRWCAFPHDLRQWAHFKASKREVI
ncbi:MAG: hypothetical protein ACLQVJ_10340 [Syntrophobacteraceae bacterium]